MTRRYTIDSSAAILWMQTLLSSQAEVVLVPLAERLPLTGDPEDDYVLATGRIARADYLVTGDKGLLAMGVYEGTRMVSPREFGLWAGPLIGWERLWRYGRFGECVA